MHQVLQEHAAATGVGVDDLQPEQWLSSFYEKRKGSGKTGAVHTPPSARTTRSVAV
jgi:type IV secretion system protein VirB4